MTATLLILLLIPLTLFVGVYYFAGRKYYFISLLILLECMLPFFLIFEGRKPQARVLVLIAVLVALNRPQLLQEPRTGWTRICSDHQHEGADDERSGLPCLW